MRKHEAWRIYVCPSCKVRAWCYGAFASINGSRLSTVVCAVANAIHWLQIQEFTWLFRKHYRRQPWWACRTSTKVKRYLGSPCWQLKTKHIRTIQQTLATAVTVAQSKPYNSLNCVLSFTVQFINSLSHSFLIRYVCFAPVILRTGMWRCAAYRQPLDYWRSLLEGRKSQVRM